MNVARSSSASRSTRQRGLTSVGASGDPNTKENKLAAQHQNTGSYHPSPLGVRNAPDAAATATAATVKQPAATTAQPVTNKTEEKPYETIEEKKNGEVVRRFLKGKLLGKGGFAKAYWCTCLQTQKQFAMKVVLKATLAKPKAKAKLQAEVKIHASLRHQYVVRFHHFFEDDEAYYMLLELAHNKSFSELMKKRKRLTQPEVQYYLWQILDALVYLHGVGVIHRDLKLGNLLLDKNMRVKIGDLGLAAVVSEVGERKRTLCGTPNYIAPEILENKHGHSFQVDIWSTGVVLYTMLVGRPPYESKDVKATYKRILANDFVFPETANLSSEAKDLISSMLQTDPTKRPSVSAIQSHPFFVGTPDAMPASALHTPPAFAPSSAMPTPALQEPGPGTSTVVVDPPKPQQSSSRQQQLRPQQQQKQQQPSSSSSSSQQPAQLTGSQRRGRSDSAAAPVARTAGANVVSAQPEKTAAAAPSFRPASTASEGERVLGSSKRGGESAVATAAAATTTLRETRSSNEHPKVALAAAAPTSGALPLSRRSSSAARTEAHSNTGTFLTSSSSTATGASAPPRRRSRSRSTGPASAKPSSSKAASSATAASSSCASSALNSAENPLVSTQCRAQGSDSEQPMATNSKGAGGGGGSSPGFGVTRDLGMTNHGGKPMTATAFSSTAMSSTGGLVEMGTLESIHHNLATTMATLDGGAASGRPEAGAAGRGRSKAPSFALPLASKPSSWVTQYVDYTSKYGLGYLLSDGSTGVYFNDSTKIVLSPTSTAGGKSGGGSSSSGGGGADISEKGGADSELKFQYMERVRSSEGQDKHVATTERFETHTLGSYPPALHKKVTLLQHFRDYLIQQQKEKLEKEQGKGAASPGDGSEPASVFPRAAPRTAWGTEDSGDEALVFVKKWVRTRHAILFRLSNQTVQVMFLDNTEVLLSQEATVVTYADKQGLRKSMALQEVMEQGRSDIIKRLKYTKDILRQLISSGKR